MWIVVKDEIPRQGQTVLTWDGSSFAIATLQYCDLPQYWVFNTYGSERYWDFEDLGQCEPVSGSKITHWQRLEAP